MKSFSKKDVMRAYAVGYLDGLKSHIDMKKIVFVGMARKELAKLIKTPTAKGKAEG